MLVSKEAKVTVVILEPCRYRELTAAGIAGFLKVVMAASMCMAMAALRKDPARRYQHASELAGEHEDWAFVNVNVRPYYAEGSKTLAFEVAEQLGWQAPDHVVVPIASGSQLTKIHKGFNELHQVGLLVLAAGFETTVNLIGNAVALLDRHPDQVRWLLANPDGWANAVDEVLRLQ